jgi:hypothetical protein
MRRISVLVAFMFTVGVWAGFAAPASAQYATILTCGFSTVQPGDTVTVSGDGYDPGSQVTISITDEALPAYVVGGLSSTVNGAYAADVLITTVDANGEFSATFTIPTDTPAGMYAVLADGIGVDLAARGLSCPVQVQQIAEVPIAFTGSNSKPFVQIALAAIALGALLVFATRRRSDEEQPVNTGV